MQVLSDHPAVLDDPEPMVLVEELGSSTVNLRVYLWVDTHRLSGLKVRSSVIRQVMRKLEAAGISMPDDAREVVFPDQVPVRMLKQDSADSRPDTSAGTRRSTDPLNDVDVSSCAEGDFSSEVQDLNEQARSSRDPDGDETDLLDSSQVQTVSD